MDALVNACNDGFRVVLDLSSVPYMSSAGLRVIVVAARKCKEENSEIVICGLQESLREIFQISRFDTIFNVFDDRALALGYFGDGGAA